MRWIPRVLCTAAITMLLTACGRGAATSSDAAGSSPVATNPTTAARTPARFATLVPSGATPPAVTPSVPATTPRAPTTTGSISPPAGNIQSCGTGFIPSATVAIPPHLRSLKMVTATMGWATYRNRVGAFFALQTTDGGEHWNAVTPAGIWDVLAGPTSFLGDRSAWVLLSLDDLLPDQQNARKVILRTTDGGGTWQCGEPFVPGGTVGQMTFADTTHGGMLVSLGVSAGSERVALFGTDDGGMHWTTRTRTTGQTGTTTPGGLPPTCLKRGLAFRDAMTGWVGGDCNGGDPFFYVTHDGGRTWQRDTLPPLDPRSGPLTGMLAVTPPIFTSPADATLLVRDSSRAILYRTGDGGMTWKPLLLPANPTSAPHFNDAAMGWMTDGVQLSHTGDGGEQWTAITPVVNPQGTSFARATLDFMTDTVGFATTADAQPTSLNVPPIFLKTADGGRTWERKTVVLAP